MTHLGRRGSAIAVAGHNDVDTLERLVALHTLDVVEDLAFYLAIHYDLIHSRTGIRVDAAKNYITNVVAITIATQAVDSGIGSTLDLVVEAYIQRGSEATDRGNEADVVLP